MSHTPFGYRIRKGKAVIDEPAAEKIRQLYKNYLTGMSLENAAKEAGIETYHGTVKRMMENRHYLGDDFYPAIIDVDTFTEAMLERQCRMKALGRTDRSKPAVLKTAPTNFHFGEVAAYYDDPVSQAEYLYSLIERGKIMGNGRKSGHFLKTPLLSSRNINPKKQSYLPWCIWTRKRPICTFLLSR